MQGHTSFINSVRYLPSKNNEYIVSASNDKEVSIHRSRWQGVIALNNVLTCPDNQDRLQRVIWHRRSECVTWQVRMVNIVKKAVMPYKNHKGKVKSIAVIDPGE